MNADWDEIKRLAADFQKAQLSSTLQRYKQHISICLRVIFMLFNYFIFLVYQNEIVLKLLHCY